MVCSARRSALRLAAPMTMRRVHVGQAILKGGLQRYAKAFDLLEVKSDPTPPSLKQLKRLRGEAPEGFVFSLVAGRGLADLAQAEPDAKLVSAIHDGASALGARWVVLRTPATVQPSTRSRARLERLTKALQGAAEGLAWEPRGIWSEDEMVAVAEEFGLTLVRDLAEHEPPPGDIVYTRLLGLGRNLRIGSGAIERVAERLEDATLGFVIVEGQGGVAVAKALRGTSVSADDEDEDGDFDDDADGTDEDDEDDE
jgi:uncharacterized protein YecE (DUF72 family)